MNLEYFEHSRQNAIAKQKLEYDILNEKNILMNENTKILLAPNCMESQYLITKMIHDNRLNELQTSFYNKDEESSFHQCFVNLYGLNSLRRDKVPHFEYFNGVFQDEGKLYLINEKKFNDFNSVPLTSIISELSPKKIINIYLGILMSLYEANQKVKYTHYDLDCSNIEMRYISPGEVNVKYTIDGNDFWLDYDSYIPVIKNTETSFIRLYVDEGQRSFGMNNLDKIPCEDKGIYVDRDFPITDAYRLLKDLMRITIIENTSAYRDLNKIWLFFDKYVDEKHQELDFIPYEEKYNHLSIKKLIDYIIKYFPLYLKFNPENVVNVNGYDLTLRNKESPYLFSNSLIQLYDLIKFHYAKDKTQKTFIKEGVAYYLGFYYEDDLNFYKEFSEKVTDIVENCDDIYEISNNTKLLNSNKYLKDFRKHIIQGIEYFNYWDLLKIYTKVMKYLEHDVMNIGELSTKFQSLLTEYENYYNTLYETLVKNVKIIEDYNIESLYSFIPIIKSIKI